MTYSNFTRPLWQWLGNPDARVDFFGTPLAGPTKVAADVVLATHRDLSSAFSWPVRNATMNALNTHDTARAASVMIPGGPVVAAAMSMLLPGIPVIFAGDEFGLEGDERRGLAHADAVGRAGADRHGPARCVCGVGGLAARSPAMRGVACAG